MLYKHWYVCIPLKFFVFLGRYPVVGLLDHRVALFLTFWGISILFSIGAIPVCIPPTNTAPGFLFVHINTTPVVPCVVEFSHPDRCEVISHCSFDLYFPDAEWCWAFFFFFYVSVGHVYVFCGKMSVHVVCPFLNWIFFCFLGVEFNRLFIDFRYSSLVW